LLAAEADEFTDVTRNGFTEPNPRYDNGHEFFTVKNSLRVSHPEWDMTWVDPRSSSFSYRQKGPILLNVPQNVSYGGGGVAWKDPQSMKLSASEANRLGNMLIAQTLPTKSPASLSQALLEILIDFPKIVGMGLLHARPGTAHQEIGGEFLNYVFGVAPTISDFKALMSAIKHTSKTVQQYQRDSGRNVRRRRSLEPVKKVQATSNIALPSNGQNRLFGWDNMSVSAGSVNLTETWSIRTWFSGAYTYHLSDDTSLIGRFQRYEQEANLLLGTRITWDTIYNLTPWSWLLDWFTDIGGIIANASYLGSDGLVLRYGYLMNHVKYRAVYSLPTGADMSGAKTGPISNTLEIESKERVRATPYGFGTLLDGLSTKQWAILGALGLTRAPQVLF
jgi:hypothetical protein